MIVIDIKNLTKRYSIGLPNYAKDFLNKIIGRSGFWLTNNFIALKNINISIKKGEIIGIIGKNGAGKSTLLKLLAGVSYPNSGSIKIKGSITPLLQLGAGFHPELTGRENIYLNGIILGMSRNEIKKNLDSIIRFSELGDFIDTPVKKYSSGMYVRLGFSIAIHANSDIFLIDEVLSVGDQSFKNKSYSSMMDIKNSGKTIIFISHSMPSIRALCKRVIWLENGEIKLDGDPDKVVSEYLKKTDSNSENKISANEKQVSLGDFIIEKIQFLNDVEEVIKKPISGQNLKIQIKYKLLNQIKNAHIRLIIGNSMNPELFDLNSLFTNSNNPNFKNKGIINILIKKFPLASCSQPYFIEMDLVNLGGLVLEDRKRIFEFKMETPFNKLGFNGEGVSSWSQRDYPIYLDYDIIF